MNDETLPDLAKSRISEIRDVEIIVFLWNMTPQYHCFEGTCQLSPKLRYRYLAASKLCKILWEDVPLIKQRVSVECIRLLVSAFYFCFAVAHATIPSCVHRNIVDPSGDYDPDGGGGLQPFPVQCVVVHHNQEDDTAVDDNSPKRVSLSTYHLCCPQWRTGGNRRVMNSNIFNMQSSLVSFLSHGYGDDVLFAYSSLSYVLYCFALHCIVLPCILLHCTVTQIAKFVWPTWGPPGSWRPQVGPTLAPWILLSGKLLHGAVPYRVARVLHCTHGDVMTWKCCHMTPIITIGLFILSRGTSLIWSTSPPVPDRASL